MNIVALIGVNSDRKDPINLDGLITVFLSDEVQEDMSGQWMKIHGQRPKL